MFNERLVKPSAYRDDDYLEFVRNWPCFVCRSEMDVQAAHTGEHGLSTKAPDIRAVNLCRNCHLGPQGLDRIGPERFEKMHNVNLREQSLKLINAYLTMGNALLGLPF